MPNSARPDAALPHPGRARCVIALVEDDDSLRAALARVLRASGYAARAYPNAEDALADPAWPAPDAWVVDLALPAMSGLDLVERLRALGVTAPAVVITGADSPRVREQVQRRGVEHFLPKPFRGSTLVDLIDRVLTCQRGN